MGEDSDRDPRVVSASAIASTAWRVRVMWRTVSGSDLCEWSSEATSEGASHPPCVVACALEWRGIVAGWSGRERWPVSPPADIMRLAPCADQWSTLRALAALDVYVLALDGGIATLGIAFAA